MNINHVNSIDNASGWLNQPVHKPSLWARIWGTKETTYKGDPLLDYPPIEVPEKGDEPKITGRNEELIVSAPSRSPLDAFKDAITDATRQFCEQNVHPIYSEDRQTKFRVTGIKMYVPKARNELMEVIEHLPIDVRNRLALLRAQGAPGALEQLVFDDSFFGITIDIEPAVIDGQYVSLITSWSKTSLDIKMAFSGQYVTVKLPVEKKPDTTSQTSVEKDTAAVRPAMISVANVSSVAEAAGKNSSLATLATTDVRKSADRSMPETTKPFVDTESPVRDDPLIKRVHHDETAIEQPKGTRLSNETPLGFPQQQKTGKDTYIPVVQRRPIARVHLLVHGEPKEKAIELFADMFPYVIGREYTASGRFEHGLNLFVDGDDPSVMLISREHLELRFEPNQNHFQIVNHAHNRNGTYHNGCAVPERFIFKASGNQNALVLGGPNGPGTVRAVFEVI